MTNRTAWPTVAPGDTWTAAQFNTYCRDNDLAYWAYQAAGDMVYATSNAALARLAIGAAGTVLQSNGSVPSWGALPALSGKYHTMYAVAFAPSQSVGGPWADINGATVTLILGVTCSILVLASVTGYDTDTTAPFSVMSVQAVVDGVADVNGGNFQDAGDSISRNETFGYAYLATGIAAGSRIVKLQARGGGANAYITAGWMIAVAVTD